MYSKHVTLLADLILTNPTPQFLLVDLFVFDVNNFILPQFKIINNLRSIHLVHNNIIFHSSEKELFIIQ